MTRRLHVVADDFGLSPGVDDAILELIRLGRLSGTGCMTVFPDWPVEAERLACFAGRTSIGLHLCLTDQQALSGPCRLAPDGRLPPLGRLLRTTALGRAADEDVFRELDLQLQRFDQAFGRPPDYIDGHQHVHFLSPVRRWLSRLARRAPASLPWLRGAPAWPRPAAPMAAKIAVVRMMAAGFDRRMRADGFVVRGPLCGFYDWTNPAAFIPALSSGLATLPEGAIFMCHPGRVDAALRGRDGLIEARPVEFEALSSDRFLAEMRQAGVSLAGSPLPQPGLAAPAGGA